MHASILQNCAIEALIAAGVYRGDRATATVVGNQQQTDLLVGACGKRGIRSQHSQQTRVRSRREEINLHGLRIKLRRQFLPSRRIVVGGSAGVRLYRTDRHVNMLEVAVWKLATRWVGNANAYAACSGGWHSRARA